MNLFDGVLVRRVTALDIAKGDIIQRRFRWLVIWTRIDEGHRGPYLPRRARRILVRVQAADGDIARPQTIEYAPSTAVTVERKVSDHGTCCRPPQAPVPHGARCSHCPRPRPAP